MVERNFVLDETVNVENDSFNKKMETRSKRSKIKPNER